MTKEETNNDIDALLRFLDEGGWEWHHAALTALVAERDEYKARCKAQHEVIADMVGKQREADRDLRERLVCAALTGLCSAQQVPCAALCRSAVATADATLAEMRKEGGGS